MQDEIDLEFYVSEISDTMLNVFFAIEDDEPVEHINNDLDSVQEALNNYGKVFLELGEFSYGEYDSYFRFDDNEIITGLSDRYYDKYKFSLAGYGIFIDSDLNVEGGYYTVEAPPSGHGPGYTSIHDFKDARKDDAIKEKVYSLLSWTGIEDSQTSPYENNPIDYTEWVDRKTNLEILQIQLTFLEDIITSFTKLNKIETDISQSILKKFEDQLTDIKMHLDNTSLSAYEITNYNFKINKIESEIISIIKQKMGDNLFKRLCTEIDDSYYSSLCKKISEFFSVNYETDDEILKYLCNNFPANTVYLFIFLHEPHALSSNTFDKGLHNGGVLIKLMDGTILSNWYDVVDKSNVKYVIEDLSNETNLSGKYESCTNLISAKFTGIRKDVTDMSRMFHDCSSLTDVSCLSEWDVSNVTNMKGMFAACRSLVSVSGLSKWNVSNVTNMKDMFCACYSLEDISGLSKWNVSNVTNMQSMFSGCWHLDVSCLSEWDVSNVENMNEMFRGCIYLVDVSGLSEWDVSNVTNMKDMFVACGHLVSVSGLSEWDVSNVTNMKGMFEFCNSLVDISCLSKWDMSNVENISGMFEGCESLVDISCLSEWDVSNVEDMVYMFNNCSSLVDISCLSEWDVSNVTDMEKMFEGCKSLVDDSLLKYWSKNIN